MDLLDLEYEMRKKDDELQRQLWRLASRIDELTETLNEVRANVNNILNGDDTDEAA